MTRQESTHQPTRSRRQAPEKDRVRRSNANQRMRKSSSQPRPWGREAVMTAVLDAATALFAARGPASVSVRDIASAARINHALVHRHFGSKQDMLRAVLERAAQEMAAISMEETSS